MKRSTGIVRKLDDLGRLVIPMELRRMLGIEDNSPMEIFMDGENIVLRVYRPACMLCNNDNEEEVIVRDGKRLCRQCLSRFSVH